MATIVESARALAPLLTARAAEGEARRTMPPDVVAAVRQERLFAMASPRSLGGLGADPVSIIAAVEELSRADGSAGWTTLIGNSVTFFAWLDPAVAKLMLEGEVDHISTGVFSALGRARRDGDDLVLDGRWPFNSGCLHADWFQAGFFVMDGEEPARRPDGQPDWRLAFFRSDEAEVVDTWRGSGLRGTGSHDVVARDVRVPEAHTATPWLDPPRHDGPILALGFRCLTGSLLTGFPLGVARRALDELEAVAPRKRRALQEVTIAEDRYAQMEIARAEGLLQSARALAVECYGEAWTAAEAEGTTTPAHRRRMLLATHQAMEAALAAVDVAHRIVGSSAAYDDHPVGRCFRDLHAASQHVIWSGELFAAYARDLLGVAA
jgi:indole-3-acetate monooxygenase